MVVRKKNDKKNYRKVLFFYLYLLLGFPELTGLLLFQLVGYFYNKTVKFFKK